MGQSAPVTKPKMHTPGWHSNRDGRQTPSEKDNHVSDEKIAEKSKKLEKRIAELEEKTEKFEAEIKQKVVSDGSRKGLWIILLIKLNDNTSLADQNWREVGEGGPFLTKKAGTRFYHNYSHMNSRTRIFKVQDERTDSGLTNPIWFGI